jgi:DNA-binding protein HU-beta
MNSKELVAMVAKNTGITKKNVNLVLDDIKATIAQTVASGEKVVLVDFGVFETTKRKARKGRNPKTGEELEIEAKKVVSFSAGRGFKDAVNGNDAA